MWNWKKDMKYVELEKGHEICKAGLIDESEGLVLLKDEGTG